MHAVPTMTPRVGSCTQTQLMHYPLGLGVCNSAMHTDTGTSLHVTCPRRHAFTLDHCTTCRPLALHLRQHEPLSSWLRSCAVSLYDVSTLFSLFSFMCTSRQSNRGNERDKDKIQRQQRSRELSVDTTCTCRTMTLSCTCMALYHNNRHSGTCLRRPLKGPSKGGLCYQVVSLSRVI